MPEPLSPPVVSSGNILGAPTLTVAGLGVFAAAVGDYLMNHGATLPTTWQEWAQLGVGAIVAGAMAFLRGPQKATAP